MRRNALFLMAIMATMAMALTVAAGVARATFTGPNPWITGNDTGGIIPYSPDIEGSYEQIAQNYCARWNRLSHVTSVHRVYGDYVSFVCIDKPGMIH